MVSSRHILRQGSTLAGLGRTALFAAAHSLGVRGEKPDLPGPRYAFEVAPRSKELVRDYIEVVGGDPRLYRGQIPPHFFPQWTFGPAVQTLRGLPYPMAKGVNGGCRLEVNGPLPLGEPLVASVQLVDIDDDGRRAIFHQRVETGPVGQPDAVVAHLYPIVVYGKRKRGEGKSEPPTVPADAKEVAFWRIGPGAGLDYAKVSGDFNPIHWLKPWARLSGFPSTILHGFATMARAMEGLNLNLFARSTPLTVFDVQFRRPLVLPAKAGLYVHDGEDARQVFVGAGLGAAANMVGTFQSA